jgi:hypothetical protein
MNALVPNGGGNGKLPAVRKPVKPAHFYKFVRDADIAVEYFEELLETRRELWGGSISLSGVAYLDDPETLEMIDDCLDSLRRYDRDGKNDPRYDEDGDLTSAYVSDRLALMLAAWTTKPKFETDEQAVRWSQIMLQHVMALEPSAVELESACRKLVDEGKPFCPETPEVIKALKAEQKAWEPRKQAICNAKRLIEEIREEIPKAKARAEKAKIEAAKRKAEEEAAAAPGQRETGSIGTAAKPKMRSTNKPKKKMLHTTSAVSLSARCRRICRMLTNLDANMASRLHRLLKPISWVLPLSATETIQIERYAN